MKLTFKNIFLGLLMFAAFGYTVLLSGCCPCENVEQTSEEVLNLDYSEVLSGCCDCEEASNKSDQSEPAEDKVQIENQSPNQKTIE